MIWEKRRRSALYSRTCWSADRDHKGSARTRGYQDNNLVPRDKLRRQVGCKEGPSKVSKCPEKGKFWKSQSKEWTERDLWPLLARWSKSEKNNRKSCILNPCWPKSFPFLFLESVGMSKQLLNEGSQICEKFFMIFNFILDLIIFLLASVSK